MKKYPFFSDDERLQSVKKLLQQLRKAGFKAYIVGGAVRDLLLNRSINDIDLTTDATPSDLLGLFPDAKLTGIAHGTLTVVDKGYAFEVTTFRTEGPYRDGRRPAFVTFETDLMKDLSRRDFTMNAIAMDEEGIFYDPYDGISDLARKEIRAVGEPELRFREDGLRIARAYRFSAMLNFTIAPETKQALQHCATKLGQVSMERRRDEWTKWLTYASATDCANLPQQIFSQWTGLTVPKTVLQCKFYSMIHGYLDRLALMSLAINNNATDKPEESTVQLLSSMKYSRKEMREVAALVVIASSYLREPPSFLPLQWTSLLAQIGESGLIRAVHIAKAMQFARSQEPWNVNWRIESEREVTDLLAYSPLRSLHDLAVTGEDLLKSCNLRGKEIGAALSLLYENVSQGVLRNERAELMRYIHSLKHLLQGGDEIERKP